MFSSGGYLSNSLIAYNYATLAGGGIALTSGGIIRNCVIALNTGLIGGVTWSGASPAARMENCTIVSNSNVGLRFTRWSGNPISNIVNCVIYWNGGDQISTHGQCETAMVACCVSVVPAGYLNPGGTTNNPMLIDMEHTNFRLSSAQSSCYNHGVNLAWMADATDLDSNRRIDRVVNVVDIGAYEFEPKISLIKTW